MKITVEQSIRKEERLPELECMQGGDTFTVVPDGVVYVRCTGATGKGFCDPEIKLAVSLLSGKIAAFPAGKRVYPVRAEARVYSEYGTPKSSKGGIIDHANDL